MMSIIKHGAEALLRVVRGLDVNAIYNGMGILKDGAMSGFRFLTLNVRVVAFLDPRGFAKDKTVRIPALVTQVVDRNQECELLPPHSFADRDMKIEQGQLIVTVGGRKTAFPISPIKGEGGERIVTMDGKKLYAINTNQENAAFDALWLSPYSKYRNKRMVVACDGDKVIPTKKGMDRRVMKAVYNAEVIPETRRIVNMRTGQTMWLPTLFVAMPFNLLAGLSNVVLLVPNALLNGVRKLLNGAAGMCENRAQNLAISRSRGTAVGSGFTSPWPFMICGAILRICDRVIALCSSIVGCVRAITVNSLMLVPVLTNASINLSSAQYGVAKQCAYETGKEVWGEVGGYADDLTDSLRFYMLNTKRAINSRPAGWKEEKASDNRSNESASRERDATECGVRSDNAAHSARSSDPLKGRSQVTIDRIDMSSLRDAGGSLARSGATVSYGTKQQVSYGMRIKNGDEASKEAVRGGGRGAGV